MSSPPPSPAFAAPSGGQRPLVRVLRMMRAHLGSILLLLGILAAQVGMQLLRPWPVQFAIDGLLNASSSVTRFFAWVGPAGSFKQLAAAGAALMFIVFMQNLLNIGSLRVGVSLAHELVAELRRALYAHLQKLSLIFHKRQQPADVLKRVAVDTFAVQSLVNNQIFPTISAGVTLVAMLVIMLRLDSVLAVVALGVIPILLLAIIRVSRRVDHQATAAQQADSRVYQSVEEGLSAMALVQATSQEQVFLRRFVSTSRESLSANLQLYLTQGIFILTTEVIAAAGTALLLILGVQHVQEKRLTVGELLVFLAYLTSLYAPINTIAQNICWGHASLAGLRRVFEFLDLVPDVTDPRHAAHLGSASGQLEFENVTFGYVGERPILQNVSFRVEPGQRVAIVGASGTGKTTLLGLTARFFDPQKGRILLDGRDIRTLRLADLRSQITLVLQETILLAASVEENLLFGAPVSNAADVESAARAARAHEFILRLPQGYKTILDSDGQTLSGGQRQRLGIARGLLRKTPVLMLDEPTSAMDSTTERHVLDAILSNSGGQTTLIVTHRLSLARLADVILVVEDGRIVEQGSHEHLIGAQGAYATLAHAGGVFA